jgi:monosaccharide-transporting ATPase
MTEQAPVLPAADAPADIVAMRGIDKSFPGVQALRGVDFSVRRGEIHALLGENGAGKSTLVKILTGVEPPDVGTITFDGTAVAIRSPLEAQAIGITTVYQEVNLCPNLTVAENLLIGREPRHWGRVDWGAMNRRAREVLKGLDIDIDVTRPLGSYSVAIQQMAAIGRALVISSAKVLVLDEPTSSLTVHETQQLFRVMRQLRDGGMAIVFITHFLDQVYEVSDRLTVLRNGALVGTYETAALPRIELIRLMLGRSLTALDEIGRHKMESSKHIGDEVLLQADGLGLAGSARSSGWPGCSAPGAPRSPISCSASTARPTAR